MKKSSFLIACLLIGFSSLAQYPSDEVIHKLADDLTEKVSRRHLQTLAVTSFTDDEGGNEKLAHYLDEEFVIHLINNKRRITITDRRSMEAMLKSHDLRIAGAVDQQTAREIGRFSGIQAIAACRFQVLETGVRLRVKVIDTGTGNQIAASAMTIPLDQNIRSLISQ